MDKCFVIQPFDNGKYDKRYKETFKPAIESCNLYSYRVDEDPSANILIEDIEKNIRSSVICFAEITTDNPNVWYELGYAIACNKDIVMVCSSERGDKFPFDIKHRKIITYKTDTQSDFEQLSKNIIERIKALLSKQNTFKQLSQSSVKETEGLTNHEITALVSIMSNQHSDGEIVWYYSIQQDMNKRGFNDLAINIALKKLERKKLIEVSYENDNNNFYDNNNVISYYRITQSGQDWIFNNEDELSLTIDTSEEYPTPEELLFNNK